MNSLFLELRDYQHYESNQPQEPIYHINSLKELWRVILIELSDLHKLKEEITEAQEHAVFSN